MFGQLQYYIIPMLACFCFLSFIFIGKATPMKKVSGYFTAGTITILIVIFSEMAESFFTDAYYTHGNWQRWLFSMVAYILRPAIAYILLLILLRNRKKTKFLTCLLASPLAVNTLLLLISPLCGVVYYFDAQNHFTSGPLRIMPFVTGFLYLAIFILIFANDAKRNGNAEWLVSIPVAITCGLAIYLESEFELLGSLPMACIIGMIFYYIYFYVEYYTKDSLTGGLQRSAFYNAIKRYSSKYFIIFDVNGLKRINDQNGHISGDSALRSFAQTTFSILPKRARLYRIGGDEFVVLYFGADKKDVDYLLKRIENNLDKDALPFGISYGWSAFDKESEFNNAYRIADEMLYKNKAAFWDNYNSQTVKENKAD